jgi:hypothetical protein
MSQSDRYKRKADELLQKAALTADAAERSALVEQAAHWHNLALACNHDERRSGGPASDPGAARRSKDTR